MRREPAIKPVEYDVAALAAANEGASALQIVERSVTELFPGEITSVSSFGAESVVLLHMISKVDPRLPILFLETGKHFTATLEYRDRLIETFGLTHVINLRPYAEMLRREDPYGVLFAQDKDACCRIRKVIPLAEAIKPYAAWMTGRKQYQSKTRAGLPVFEAVDWRVRINPLSGWSAEDIEAYMSRHDLPRHPLVARGFPSIGCQPCTRAVSADEDARAGRWAGTDKTECGIHLDGLSDSLKDLPLTGTDL